MDNTNTADRRLAKHRTEASYEVADKRYTRSNSRPAKKAYNRASRRHGKALARAAY